MNTMKLKPITTLAAACVLSLMSASALAERGGNAGGATMRGGGAAAATTRASAPMTRATAAPAAKTTAAPATARSTRTARTTTGQPNASCEDIPNQPGNSMSAPGSAFNPDGVSGTHYAGEQPQNSKNPKSVSQYDVACARNRSH